MLIHRPVFYIVLFVLPRLFGQEDEGEFVNFLTRNNLAQGKAEVVFLLDRSGSVGAANFEIEKGFVESLLTHVVVDVNATRVAVISYSTTVERHIDFLRTPKNKCFLSQELQQVIYRDSGATNIAGALEEAHKVLKNARPNVNKVVILISDGLATYGVDPEIPAKKLKKKGAQIFAFGIGRFLRSQLQSLASSPRHIYGCSGFKEFKKLARTIRGDPHETEWSNNATIPNCDHLCVSPYAGQDNDPGCCDPMARCSCALLSGVHTCVCATGYFGLSGLIGDCKACPKGTYKSQIVPSSSCTYCPLHATTAEIASTSIRDCYCKEGYSGSPRDGSPCSIVKCPQLQAPENGYKLGRCENVFGSSCDFVCEEEFELTNKQSEVRTCGTNGHWTGTTAVCQRKRCNEPANPKYGVKICNDADFFIGTICKFECIEGYDLIGSMESECLKNKMWSAKFAECKEKQCPVLAPLKYGTIHSCSTDRKPILFQSCVFTCNFGFEIQGPQFMLCGSEGKLVDAFGKQSFPICKDIVKPNIQCPKPLTLTTIPGKKFSSVSWHLPITSDNSGEDLSIEVFPKVQSPTEFKIGTHEILYKVTDKAGLSNSCVLTITVEDRERPKVVSCPSTVEVNTTDLEIKVHWDEPEFKDNSEKVITIIKTHSSGEFFEIGSHIVTYTAKDESKNEAKCTFKVLVSQNTCPYHPAPVNGAFACEDWMYGQFCQAYCQDEYEFSSQPADWYVCNSEAEWQTIPQGLSIPWPDCASRYSPHRIRTMLNGFYYSGNCSDPDVQKAIQEIFIKHFVSKFNTSQYCSWEGACTVEMVKVTCGEIQPEHSRTRRDTWHDAANGKLELEIELFFSSEKEMENHAKLLQKLMETMQNLSWNEDDNPITFVVQNDNNFKDFPGTVVLTSGEAELVCELGSILKEDKCVFCPPGSYYLSDVKSCFDCGIGEYQENEGQVSCNICPDGYSTEDVRSKNSSDCKMICTPGTFSSTGLETCISCPLGTYQSQYGQTSFETCPNGTTTSVEGAISIHECKTKCSAGAFSESGLQFCQPCPLGYYQPSDGQIECLECPQNFTTISTGAISLEDCIDYNACSKMQCQHQSTCLPTKHGFSCLCLKGYSGDLCEDDVNECLQDPCINNGKCVNLNGSYYCNCTLGFQGLICEEERNECESNPCLNGALCVDEIANYTCFCQSGFTGQYCENVVDYCSGFSTCHNGGVCEVLDGTPSCKCSKGFIGVDCSININDCEEITCYNNGSCVDAISSFYCQCSPGFTGELCKTNIDDCLNHNCHEGSTCMDLVADYSCLCQPGWSGSRCENKLSSDFVLSFPEVATVANMAQVKIESPLSEVTVSMWVQTTDVHRPGTPLSYAAAHVGTDLDNALTFSDCSGLQLYVNNEPLPTDLQVADGLWHHLAFTWSSEDSGRWSLYKDGALRFSGIGLQNGNAIPGNGILVLGQEQDYVGGGFSPVETFTGNISRVNVWNRVLSNNNVVDLCKTNDDIPGKIVAWADFLGSAEGKVQVINNAKPFLFPINMASQHP